MNSKAFLEFSIFYKNRDFLSCLSAFFESAPIFETNSPTRNFSEVVIRCELGMPYPKLGPSEAAELG
jgi:hypothetical protein